MLVYPDGRFAGTVGGGEVEVRIIKEALDTIRNGKPARLEYNLVDPGQGDPGVCGGTMEVFVEPILPRPQLVIIGGGHVGKAVGHLAKWLSFHVVISDDRPEFCTPEANPDAGATFIFYLPASEIKATVVKPVKKAPFIGKGKLLVMDDEEMVREIIGTMAAHLGYEVESAKDGAEAIELYQKAKESNQPFDAVIMDLIIPDGMGGKETIKKLLEIDPHAKAIVSSGYSDDPVMAHYREYGFSGVIKKPYRIATFSKVLADCLQS